MTLTGDARIVKKDSSKKQYRYEVVHQTKKKGLLKHNYDLSAYLGVGGATIIMPPVAELTNSQNRQREKRTPIVVSARGQTNAFRGECDLCRLLFPYLPYILSSYLISRHLCRLPKEKHIVLKPFLAHTFDIVHTIDYPTTSPPNVDNDASLVLLPIQLLQSMIYLMQGIML